MVRTISRRKRILILCEGNSERGYAVLLQRLADANGRSVHIEPLVIKAGNPLDLMNRAMAEIERIQNRNRSRLGHKYLMLDTDLLDNGQEHHQIMNRHAGNAGIKLVRQKVCFEAFLLRHFEGHRSDDPATSIDALERLRKVWPDYRKGASAMELAKRIGLADVRRAAECRLNADIVSLIDVIGLKS